MSTEWDVPGEQGKSVVPAHQPQGDPSFFSQTVLTLKKKTFAFLFEQSHKTPVMCCLISCRLDPKLLFQCLNFFFKLKYG